MKFISCALLLLVGFAPSAAAGDVAGNWRVDMVSGVAHKTIADAEFEFKVEGKKLAGTARIGHGWPGTAPISEGTIDGDQISFLILGEASSSQGYPKMKFTGTVHCEEIALTMKLFYSNESDSAETGFKGKRVTR